MTAQTPNPLNTHIRVPEEDINVHVSEIGWPFIKDALDAVIICEYEARNGKNPEIGLEYLEKMLQSIEGLKIATFRKRAQLKAAIAELD